MQLSTAFCALCRTAQSAAEPSAGGQMQDLRASVYCAKTQAFDKPKRERGRRSGTICNTPTCDLDLHRSKMTSNVEHAEDTDNILHHEAPAGRRDSALSTVSASDHDPRRWRRLAFLQP